MSEEVELTLCQLPSVFVFKIPPRRSAEGHRASDWPKEHSWNGKLKIVAKGRQCAIILQDAKNQVFAVCPVTEGAVEKTLDSGRYFVLRIQNAQGKHAYIGIAFNERNDAFDFNVALQEHQKELEREDKAAEYDNEAATGSSRDLSLKEGEKIRINIGGMANKHGRDKKASSSNSGSFLPPPLERAPGSQSTLSASGASPPIGHAFDLFGSSPSAISSSSPPSDAFGSSFGSSDPFAAPFAQSGFTASSDPFGTSFDSGTVFSVPSKASGGGGGGGGLLDF
jgi:hypothetical protein